MPAATCLPTPEQDWAAARHRLVHCGVWGLIALTLLAYLPAILYGGFVWDDPDYLTRNPFIQEGWNGLLGIWIPGNTPQYYPLVFSSFWLEYHLWGADAAGHCLPLGYHLVNVVQHILNALLLWRFLQETGVRGAWLVGFLFALHPVNVESVAWITERKNVLSGFFYLTAALAYRRFDALLDSPAAERPKAVFWKWYALASVLFLAALLSKSVTASLPAALILVRLYERKPFRFQFLAPLIPWFLIGAALGLHTAHLEQHHVGASAFFQEVHRSLGERLVVACQTLLFYPWKVLVPWPVMFNYPRWEVNLQSVLDYWPVFTVLAITVVSLWAYARGRRGLFVALSFFAGTLFPASGFLYVYPHRYSFVADHFAYLANIGTLVLLATVLLRWLPRPKVFKPACAILLALYTTLSFLQARVYRDEPTLWRDTLAKNPRSWMAWNNLSAEHQEPAEAAWRNGDLKTAARQYTVAREYAEKAVLYKPDHHNAHLTIADALWVEGKQREALRHAQRALDIILAGHARQPEKLPRMPMAYGYELIGDLQYEGGDFAAAERAYRKSLEYGPDSPWVMMRLAGARVATGHADEAQQFHREVLRRVPTMVDLAEPASPATAAKTKPPDAGQLFAAALRLVQQEPDGPIKTARLAHLALARMLLFAPDPRVKHVPRAGQILGDLVRSTPQPPAEWLELLALFYSRIGRFDAAVETAGRALDTARQTGSSQLIDSIRRRREFYEAQHRAELSGSR